MTGVSRSSDNHSRSYGSSRDTSALSPQKTQADRSGRQPPSSDVAGARPSAQTPTGFSNVSAFTPAGQRTSTGSLTFGARGEEVRALQDQLRTAGFDPGASDGIFGQRTDRALRDFQASKGLEVDGIAGRRTFAALSGVDGMDPNAPAAGGVNGTARLNGQPEGVGMTTGSITVNGNTYQFNSGGANAYSVPQGTYRVTAHRDSRSDPGFVRDGVGYSFLMEDPNRPGSDKMYDARAGRDREWLRIHPDGRNPGTEGCIGIVGDAETQRQFRADLNAELQRNGGVYTLRVE
ncbi:peptidoglycan-binding domain-containing protein [Pyxidicoccus xibeiensis]|uniref:peptidoglycan-binding domain-containing protein n=1 Tax=Pyxidicoccus xibeiensis TaxID=2906759 RepID=UPI0020A72DF8|nr:peptidoglycan-binding domain-containing protein [Pyxidicoccus xibeiensis]MCP3140925.1 peptidoglycan-binding protein [Pyxidicoccus xibeiensis]